MAKRKFAGSKKMKRVWISLSILSGVLVVGAIAIAQVQRSDRGESHAGAQVAASGESSPSLPEPIPMPETSQPATSAAPSDPFASSRLMPATHSVLVESSSSSSPAASPVSAEAQPSSAYSESEEVAGGGLAPPNPYRERMTESAPAPPRTLETQAEPLAGGSDASDLTGQIAEEYGSQYSSEPAPSQPTAESAVNYQGNGGEAAPTGDSYRGAYPPAAAAPAAPAPATPAPTEQPAPATTAPPVADEYTQAESGYQPAAPAASQPAPSQSAAGGYGESAPAEELRQARAETSYDRPTGVEGAGTPGRPELEGAQAAQLTIEKIAPPEIQVGRPATFRILVSNVGQVAANKVVLHDDVPRGTRLISSVPEATQAADGGLLFDLGTLDPGEVAEATLELMPLVEGEIGSVATVSFQTQASSSTICTRPQLVLEHTLPERVLIGQPVKMLVTITNNGTGAAENVILEEQVPTGLSHPQGSELEYSVGTLQPNESRQLELVLTAAEAGFSENLIRARGEGDLLVEDTKRIEVTAPQLQVAVSGPGRRFLDREATYVVQLSNPGTASATEIDLVAYLPAGLQFVSTNNSGQYNASQHSVHWSLAELPPQQSGTVEVVTLPIEMGDQKIRAEGHAEMDLAAESEHLVAVEGLAELFFEVADVADPIEIGNETIYEVRVINQGSKTATNVQLIAELPAGMQAGEGEGPTRANNEGNRVVFQPLGQLAPKADTLYRITVTGAQAGDHRVRFSISSDETAAVIKEESTRVYSDR